MLCIRGTSHGPVSVLPSVRPSQVGVLLTTLQNVLFKTFDGIFYSKLATVLERVAVVQSVRNTRLPKPHFTFAVNCQGQKVKFGQILRRCHFDP